MLFPLSCFKAGKTFSRKDGPRVRHRTSISAAANDWLRSAMNTARQTQIGKALFLASHSSPVLSCPVLKIRRYVSPAGWLPCSPNIAASNTFSHSFEYQGLRLHPVLLVFSGPQILQQVLWPVGREVELLVFVCRKPSRGYVFFGVDGGTRACAFMLCRP